VSRTNSDTTHSFDFAQTSCDLVDGCKVHGGFFTAWKEVASAVQSAVTSARQANPSYAVVSTGHSLGAAVATLAAAYLRKQLQIPIDLYTYGSPRVGNDAFVNFVVGQAGSEFRVTHTDDPVPRLPPIVVNFRHTTPEYWLSTGNATTVNYSADQVKVCEGTANTQCNAGTSGLDTDAHGYYFEKLGACAPASKIKLRHETRGMNDEDLTETLNAFAHADTAYVQALDQ
jgi:hypothetical protein